MPAGDPSIHQPAHTPSCAWWRRETCNCGAEAARIEGEELAAEALANIGVPVVSDEPTEKVDMKPGSICHAPEPVEWLPAPALDPKHEGRLRSMDTEAENAVMPEPRPLVVTGCCEFATRVKRAHPNRLVIWAQAVPHVIGLGEFDYVQDARARCLTVDAHRRLDVLSDYLMEHGRPISVEEAEGRAPDVCSRCGKPLGAAHACLPDAGDVRVGNVGAIYRYMQEMQRLSQDVTGVRQPARRHGKSVVQKSLDDVARSLGYRDADHLREPVDVLQDLPFVEAPTTTVPRIEGNRRADERVPARVHENADDLGPDCGDAEPWRMGWKPF